MRTKWISTFLWLLAAIGTIRTQVLYGDVKFNYEALLNSYKSTDGTYFITDVIPAISYPKTIYISMAIKAVTGFDAVNGKLHLICSMLIEWKDETGALDNVKYNTLVGSRDTVFVSYNQIWTPRLLLVNDAGTVKSIGDASYKVRYNITTGNCTWDTRLIIKADCSPDMTYFPFDLQTCVVSIKPALHAYTELKIETLIDTWDTSSLEDSGTWAVNSTSVYVSITDSKYQAYFTINIKRKPLFLSLVIVFPTLLLSLLSGFVFLLPSGSGERVGFGVTCFLAFVVLLQTIMSMLPEVSSPMSLLCYYVIVMLAFSVVLNVINIFLMRLHLNPTKSDVPRWLAYFIETITCKIWRRCCRKGLKGDKIMRTRFPRIHPYLSTFSTVKGKNKPETNNFEDNVDANVQKVEKTENTTETVNMNRISDLDDKELDTRNIDSGFNETSEKDENTDQVEANHIIAVNMKNTASPDNKTNFEKSSSDMTSINTLTTDKTPNNVEDNVPLETKLNLNSNNNGKPLKISSNETVNRTVASARKNRRTDNTTVNSKDSSILFVAQARQNIEVEHKGNSKKTEANPNPGKEETKPSPEKTILKDAVSRTDASQKSLQRKSSFETDITWPYIGKALDCFFFLVFCGVQAVFTLFILIPLASQYST